MGILLDITMPLLQLTVVEGPIIWRCLFADVSSLALKISWHLVSGIGNIKNPQQSLEILRLLYTHCPCGVIRVSMAPLEIFAYGLLMNRPREVSAKPLASTRI
jgi:hypothetical protein